MIHQYRYCFVVINYDYADVIFSSRKAFHRLRLMVVQTAYIRPLCVFIAALMWAEGVFIPSVSLYCEYEGLLAPSLGLSTPICSIISLPQIRNLAKRWRLSCKPRMRSADSTHPA